ncbi:MAG: flippase [Saprospiraceae bacterium]|nr:flippase [Saprospiraceae bacterium]
MKKLNFSRSSSQSLVANMAQQGFAMLQFMLVVRLLTPTDLGEWAMFLTLTSMVEMGRLGLVQNALVHFSTHQPVARPQLASAALVFSLGANVVGLLLLLGLSVGMSDIWQMPGLSHLFWCYAPLSLLQAVLKTLEGLRMADSDFRSLVISYTVFGGFYLVFTLFLPFFTSSVSNLALLAGQFAATILSLGILYFYQKKNWQFGKIEKQWLRQMFRFGRYGMGTNLCSMLFQRADLFLLSAFVAPSAVATYNVATRLISYLDFPLNALGLALMPRLSAVHQAQNTEGVARLYEKSVGGLLALTLPMTVGVCLAAPVLVQIVAGQSFLAAAPLIQILALAGLIKPFGRVFGVTLDAIGQPIWNFRMLLLSMVITLIFNVLLIPKAGVWGAAVASSLSVVVTILLGQRLLQRWLDVRLESVVNAVFESYKVTYLVSKR